MTPSKNEPADLILQNGKITTLDPGKPAASNVSIKFIALNCLAVGDEPFDERLKKAFASALVRLRPEDATAHLVDEPQVGTRFPPGA